MEKRFFVARGLDDPAMARIAQALEAWEPDLTVERVRAGKLYDPNAVVYCMLTEGRCEAVNDSRRQGIEMGAAIVVPPQQAVRLRPTAPWLVFRSYGPPPRHMNEPYRQVFGFDHFPLPPRPADRTAGGFGGEVIPAADLRFRLGYHYVETEDFQAPARRETVEVLYVLDGSGEVRIRTDPAAAESVAVEPGTLLAVGPGLSHAATDGLKLAIWSLDSELGHWRRRWGAGPEGG